MELQIAFAFKIILAMIYLIVTATGVQALTRSNNKATFYDIIIRSWLAGMSVLGGFVVFYYLFKIG